MLYRLEITLRTGEKFTGPAVYPDNPKCNDLDDGSIQRSLKRMANKISKSADVSFCEVKYVGSNLPYVQAATSAD